MAAKKVETKTIKLIRGVRIKGESYFPKKKKGNKEVDTVLTVTSALADQLIAAGKAELSKEKATVDLPEDEDDFDAEE